MSNRTPLALRRSILLTVAATLVTCSAGIVAIGGGLVMIANAVRSGSLRDASVFSLYLAAALTVLSAHLVFEILRLGYLRRLRRTRSDDARFALTTSDQDPPHVTILIPAYMEEPDVVARAVLSASLQTYPACDVVVLLDDAPFGFGDDRVRKSVSETAADLSCLAEFVAQARRDLYRASYAIERTMNHGAWQMSTITSLMP